MWFARDTKTSLRIDDCYCRIWSQLAHQTWFWLRYFFTFKILWVDISREDAHILFLLRHHQFFLHVFQHVVGHRTLGGNRPLERIPIDIRTFIVFALSGILDGRLWSSAPTKPASLFELIADHLAQGFLPNIHWAYGSVVSRALSSIINPLIANVAVFIRIGRNFALIVFSPHRPRCTSELLLRFGNGRTLKEQHVFNFEFLFLPFLLILNEVQLFAFSMEVGISIGAINPDDFSVASYTLLENTFHFISNFEMFLI